MKQELLILTSLNNFNIFSLLNNSGCKISGSKERSVSSTGDSILFANGGASADLLLDARVAVAPTESIPKMFEGREYKEVGGEGGAARFPPYTTHSLLCRSFPDKIKEIHAKCMFSPWL